MVAKFESVIVIVFGTLLIFNAVYSYPKTVDEDGLEQQQDPTAVKQPGTGQVCVLLRGGPTYPVGSYACEYTGWYAVAVYLVQCTNGTAAPGQGWTIISQCQKFQCQVNANGTNVCQ